MSMRSHQAEQRSRANAIRVVMAVAVLILLGKAVQLQVFSPDLRERSERIGRAAETRFPSRGLIYDRSQKLLTANEPSYQIELTYEQLDRAEQFDTLEFCKLVGISRRQFEQASTKDWSDYRFSRIKPFLFMRDLPPERFAAFQERMHEFAGFTANLRTRRTYPESAGAHLIGFMGEVDQKQLEAENSPYDIGDHRGVSGLEYEYEAALRGQKGRRQFLVDNRGRFIRDLDANSESSTEPHSGADLYTTIDLDLQAYAEQLMTNKVGAIAAIEPATGEVLALVSAPTYDPNVLAFGSTRAQAYQQLAADSLQPLLNRPINGIYPPGSPFKTLVSLIALQDGSLHRGSGMPCNGGFRSNGQLLTGCHEHPYCHNVEDAIAYSCNNYFVTTFLQYMNRYQSLSPNKRLAEFNSYLHQFGLAQKTGLDLPSEQRGFVPDSSFYINAYKDEAFWRAIWIRSLAIGQGEYELTTLQMANLTAAIANRGHWFDPHLVRQLSFGPDSLLYFNEDRHRHDIDIDPIHFETVVRGMRGVLTRGTARSAEVPGLDICGKTGTAENGTAVDHSIFVAFAPQDDPQIAVAVYVEYGGFGTTYAAPIASLMIEQYLNGEISSRSQWREDRLLQTNLLLLRP